MSLRIVPTALLVTVVSLIGATAVDHMAATATPSTTAAASVVTVTPSVVEVDNPDFDTTALDALEFDSRFAVAVQDVESGEILTYGDTGTFDTASIVKVNILAALLSAQDGELSASQQTLAFAMITYSDNDAATALFAQVGGVSGLEAYNATLGLTDTTIADSWGLTQTTPSDQLVVLEAALQFDLASELMGDVVDAQRFGVSAAADDPSDAALKVGYLQRSATGLWDVTSIGEVTSGGRTYWVAVLSDGNASFDAGVAVVDAVAAAAVPSDVAA